MADERVRHAVKITDPTTDANEAAVSASGALLIDVEEYPASAALGDADPNPTTTRIGANLMGFDGTNWDRVYTVADGDVVAAATKGFLSLGTDGTNYQVIATDASGNVQVDVIAALPTGANTIGDIANITTSVTPGTAAGNLGKAIDSVVGGTDTGVAILAERIDTPAAITPAVGDYSGLFVDVNGRLHVTDPNAGAGTPGTPTVDTPALATIAAGATSTGTELRTADLGGSSRQLAGVDISSSAPFKATLIREDNDVETIVNRGLFGQAGDALQWRPPHKAYFSDTFGANAGFDGYRAEVTNLDNSQSADFYANFYYED